MSRKQTPEPRADRHLAAVPDITPSRARRGTAVALAVGLLGGGGAAAVKGYDALQEWSRDRTAAMANAAPKVGEICVVEAKGRKAGEVSTLVLGDEYGDGTKKIQEISEAASAVMNAHPEEGVGICRPEDSSDLNDNHIVAPENIDPTQLVSTEQFNAAGGVSDDVTLGS